MMPLANWSNDLQELAGDFPSSLVYGSLTISCTASDVREEVLIDDRGDYDPTSKDVLTSLSDWQGSTPPDRATVQLDGVNYYVAERETDAGTDTFRLTLKRI